MLHDFSTYQRADPTDHDRLSAQEARRLLGELDVFSQQETDTICQAILHHRAKGEVHAPMDELLKDADVLQHYLYNPGFKQQATRSRGSRRSGRVGRIATYCVFRVRRPVFGCDW